MRFIRKKMVTSIVAYTYICAYTYTYTYTYIYTPSSGAFPTLPRQNFSLNHADIILLQLWPIPKMMLATGQGVPYYPHGKAGGSPCAGRR